MKQTLGSLYGNKLGASDGDVGRVKDFYFEDDSWLIRYLVVDTGTWIPGRKVLLTPGSLCSQQDPGNVVKVNLSRQQIENSPSIKEHEPLSRQFEEEYHRHFDIPLYWEGVGVKCLGGIPVLGVSSGSFNGTRAAQEETGGNGADAHLRSTREVEGYQLHAADGVAGHVCDYVIDSAEWKILSLVIRTGHRLSGREVELPTDNIVDISWDESALFTSLTTEEIHQCPEQRVTTAAA